MNYKIAQFMLAPARSSQSALEIYVAQPDANKEALAGKLFALVEIESAQAAGLKMINFLINSLNRDYYQNEKMILRERISAVKVEHIFEAALAKTNKKLAEFLQTEKIKLDYGSLNITVGVIYNESLHFANLGKNKAWLIYKGRSQETAKYKLADITEQAGAAEAKKQPSAAKLFSQVISGHLPRGGYFVFSSETFGEYLSAKQIINIITTLPPAGAAEQIKNTLGKINAYVPFLGIIIKNSAGLEAPALKIKREVAKTRASIENLVVTEEQTEKLLTPPGLINSRKWSSFLSGLISRGLNRPDKIGRQALFLKDKIFTKKKANWTRAGKILNYLKNALIYLFSLLIYVFKIISDKKALADFSSQLIFKIKNLRSAVKAASLRLFFWHKGLKKINKISFSVFLICFLVFSLSLVWQAARNSRQEKQALLSNLIIAVKQKQNQADASLLYNNEAGAVKLLAEIKELLKQLPQENQNQKDQYNELAAKHRVQIEKISRVVRVDLLELANFANLNARAKPKNIILTKGKIYAADAGESIFSLDLGNKLVTSVSLNNLNSSRLDFPSLDRNGNVYYLGLSQLAVLDVKSEKLSGLDIDYRGRLEKAADFKQYNNRFYLADAASGQIYRFTKSGTKLVSPVSWLSVKEDLADLVSLDIDGEVYLLKNNGEILKYAKGKKQNFSLPAVEPPLSQASKIAVSPEENYIYVLEPANKRLVVFDKNGKFNRQYASDKLDDLKDFQIDEKNKKIYFLNNATVYSADMTHLE